MDDLQAVGVKIKNSLFAGISEIGDGEYKLVISCANNDIVKITLSGEPGSFELKSVEKADDIAGFITFVNKLCKDGGEKDESVTIQTVLENVRRLIGE